MLIAHHSTASAITPHAADRSWVVFLQTAFPAGVVSPIKIAGMKGAEIGRELHRLSAANAYDIQIIGLIPSQDPDQHARAIADQYAGSNDHLHDGWYLPTAGLLAFVEHHALAPLQQLLAQVHPGSINEHVVDIEEMAKILGVSVPTVRRMVAADDIPSFRIGKGLGSRLRFVPADVVASLQQRGRR